MMPGRGVQNGLGFTEPLQELHADLRMATLLLVIHRFADVMQQAATPCHLWIEPKFRRDHLGKIGDFHRVLQHILPIAGPITKST